MSGLLPALDFGILRTLRGNYHSPKLIDAALWAREQYRLVSTRAHGPRTLLIAEQSSVVRSTKWNLGGHRHTRVLSMPRMLFVICLYRGGFENLYTFFLKKRYAGPRTALYHSVLPNSDNSGWICMGNGSIRDALTQETLQRASNADKANTLLGAFWQGSFFNEDLMERFTGHAPSLHPSLKSIAAWENASRARPAFIDDVPWNFACYAGEKLAELRRA